MFKFVRNRLLPENDRKLMPTARSYGPMPWVIAIMMFLTTLAASGAVFVGNVASDADDELSGFITVQIVEPDKEDKARQKDAVIEALSKRSDVRNVRPLSDSEALELVEPWLGPDQDLQGFAVPAMVDAELAPGTSQARIAELSTALKDIAPAARIDQQSDIVRPLTSLLRTMFWLGLALVALLALASGAVVALAARSALTVHSETIGIVHQLGGTDRQIVRLFQRRIALDTFGGSLIGFLAAIVVVSVIIYQAASIGGGDIMPEIDLLDPTLLILPLLPILGALLASAVARWTVARALRSRL